MGDGAQTPILTRRYVISGRVQGVGYRNFMEHRAGKLAIAGYARNQENGTVEVVAQGSAAQLAELRREMQRGPRFAEVTGIQEEEHPVLQYRGFHIKRA